MKQFLVTQLAVFVVVVGGNREQAVALHSLGKFIKLSSVKTDFLPNAGLRLQNISDADFGSYTVRVLLNHKGMFVTHSQTVVLTPKPDATKLAGDRVVVEVLPGTVQDDVTGQHHARLACGRFHSNGKPAVSVVWETPLKEKMKSTTFTDGRFTLNVPNPVAGGVYTCHVHVSPSAECVNSSGLMPNKGREFVDGTELRFLVLEAENRQLKMDNREPRADLEQHVLETNRSQGDVMQRLTSRLDDVDSRVEEAKSELKSRLDDLHSNLTSQVTLQREDLGANLTSELTKVDSRLTSVEQALSVTPVAFTAAVSTPGTVRATSGKVVPFHTVILNTGTVYNSSSSLFTAPRDGDYFFILNVDVSKDHDCISIRRNGGTVIVADRDDTVSTHLTGSGVMGLKRGDTVGAYHCTSAGYVESGLESTFSGFLIR